MILCFKIVSTVSKIVFFDRASFIFRMFQKIFLWQECLCLDPNVEITETSPCLHGFWANDDFCDDGNNIPECNFDEGACCNNQSPMWDIYCSECKCLEEWISNFYFLFNVDSGMKVLNSISFCANNVGYPSLVLCYVIS